MRNKILVAIDGSDQSLEAVRYAGLVMPPRHTQIVLFNITSGFSDLFDDMDNHPLYQTKIAGIKKWMAEERQSMGSYMRRAAAILENAGFKPDDIDVRTQPKKLGIARDIVKESYNDYQAVVVGRTGISRFKDWLLKSAAIKLVGKIKHIPIIVVGGQTFSKPIMIAYDGSRGALKGVSCLAQLVGASDNTIMLFSLLSQRGRFWVDDGEYQLPDGTQEGEAPKEILSAIAPALEAARDQLRNAGLAANRIKQRVQVAETDRAGRIVETALNCGYGSVVVGRRGFIGFIEEFLVGRISAKVLNMADELTVWVV